MKVLYLHPAGAFGGASKSLIELFKELHEKGVRGLVVSPKGSSCTAFEAEGLTTKNVVGLTQFDNTRFGFYRRFRWIILLRELFFLPFSIKALWELRHQSFDLLHINEITLLPIGLFVKWLLDVPVIVHVRSLQRVSETSWRCRLINYLLKRYADGVVAIDHTVKKTLDKNLPVTVIHNGLNVNNDVSVSRSVDTPVTVGFLGVLLQMKGIYELVEAIRILKERGVIIDCIIAGDNARKLQGSKAYILKKLGFAEDVKAELEKRIIRYGLQDNVKLIGFVKDVRRLFPEIDILCFPSHLNAAGRPVFEAAFYSIPSVVVVDDPAPDALVHGFTGLSVPVPDPVLIADALQKLTEQPVYRNELGVQAKAWAENIFSVNVNASRMFELYQKVISSRTIR